MEAVLSNKHVTAYLEFAKHPFKDTERRTKKIPLSNEIIPFEQKFKPYV